MVRGNTPSLNFRVHHTTTRASTSLSLFFLSLSPPLSLPLTNHLSGHFGDCLAGGVGGKLGRNGFQLLHAHHFNALLVVGLFLSLCSFLSLSLSLLSHSPLSLRLGLRWISPSCFFQLGIRHFRCNSINNNTRATATSTTTTQSNSSNNRKQEMATKQQHSHHRVLSGCGALCSWLDDKIDVHCRERER